MTNRNACPQFVGVPGNLGTSKIEVPTFSPQKREAVWASHNRRAGFRSAVDIGTGTSAETTLDPESDEERTRKIPIRLGLKTQLTKLKAREALRAEIVERNGQVPEGRVLKDSSITFG